jgi:hypothetical protein
MTILTACYADAAHSAILISTFKDGDVFVQTKHLPLGQEDAPSLAEGGSPAPQDDQPFVTDLAAWLAAGGQIAPFVPAPSPPPQISREAFCVAMIGAGILTEAEAEAAALGAWPARFEPALAGKDLVEKLTIKNIWRETKTVARDAPLFLDLLAFYATAAGLNKAQAKALGDAIFAASSA